MARGNVQMDYSELRKLRDRLQSMAAPDKEQQFMEACAKELAARLLSKVIKRTPVGQYPADTGKVGGTLRRGWTAGNEKAAGYAQSLQVQKIGSDYVIEIINPVEYASYVEYGHRTRDHKGWVKGRFMLTISENEIRRSAPAILEKKLEKYLKECFK